MAAAYILTSRVFSALRSRRWRPAVPAVLCLLVWLSCAAGCAGTDPSLAKDFVDQPLTGKVNGKDWKARYVYVDPTIDTPEENDYVFVFLDFKPKEKCPKDTEAADARTIMVSAPRASKTTKLKRGTSRTLVFHYNKKSEPVALSAKAGKLRVDDADGDKIQGFLLASYNSQNYVNGSFTAVICELGEMDKSSPWD